MRIIEKPSEVWSSVVRCWEICPTSDRIIADIEALPRVLDKIIQAKGCVVPDEFLRTGRRSRSSDGKRLLKSKPRASQRTSTNNASIYHPDVVEAKNMLLGLATASFDLDNLSDDEFELPDVSASEDESDDSSQSSDEEDL